MPLQKQPVNLNFGLGLDLKTDPNQVQLGKMLTLVNSVFNKGGQLTKRDGFASLRNLDDTSNVFLTTHNDNLTALGTSLNVLNADTNIWFNKGLYQDVDLNVQSLVRTATSQTTVDSALAYNNAVCTVFLDSSGNQYYTVSDAVTGEVITQSVALPATATCPRVCVLKNNFIVTYLVTSGLATHLDYIAVPIFTPFAPHASVTLATDVNSLASGYDIVVANNNMYFAYEATGGNIKASFIDFTLLAHVFITIPGFTAALMTLSADNTTSTPTIYISWWQSSDAISYSQAFDNNLNILPLFPAPIVVLTANPVNELTSAATSGINTIFYQITNTYGYSSVRTDFIYTNGNDATGFVAFPTTTLKRSVGLASKGFIINDTVYVMAVYAGAYQPTYFVMDSVGNIIAKLAYSNGGGYATTQVLPQGNVFDQTVSVGYLIKDLLASVNKLVNSTQLNNIYSQTGINLAAFQLNSGLISTAEIAGSLHITGGYLWMYDGVKPLEHNFDVWPEDLGFLSAGTGGGLKQQDYFYAATYEWTDAQGNIHRSAPSVPLEVNLASVTGTPITFTSSFASGVSSIVVSSATGLFVGQMITDTTTPGNIQADTTITSISGTTLGLSLPTAGISSGNTLTTADTYANTIYIPTLRLTAKLPPNPVRIVIYRWSTAEEIFYQITSIPAPIINDTTIDSVTYVDTQNDNAIIGNLQLYTNGGVLENIAAPACSVSTLWKGRMWIVDSEDMNLLWYSKPVIENTPVEFNSDSTVYVAPTIGAQANTGPITALSALDDKLIIFKKDAIYYITGDGPDITGAQNDYGDPIFITASVGCANQDSIVIMPSGLMFQSDKGIWILQRDLGTSYIGAPVDGFNSTLVTSALTVPGTNQVRFTLEGATSPTLMYDYYFNQWGTFEGIPGISSTLYQGKHTFFNQYGSVFQEKANTYLDGSRPVLMSFTTAWAQLAGLQGYQRAYFFYLLGTYISPHTLTVGISFDYNPTIQQQVIIQPVNFAGFYGDDPLYGDGSPYGGTESAIEQWRVFLNTQKCESMQITLQENFDPSFGTSAGAGLTLSGINLVYGMKKGYTTLQPSLSVG